MGLTPADDALRAHLSLPKDQGLVVTSLAANTPAAQAGIQQNDVLLKLGDNALSKAEDLEGCLKATGDKPVSLTLLRGGKSVVIPVQPQFRVTLGPVQPEPPAFWIGISISPIEPALRSQLKIPQNHGLLAIDVVKDSPMAVLANVKVHDILLSLDGKGLDSQEKARRIGPVDRPEVGAAGTDSRRENADGYRDAPAPQACSTPGWLLSAAGQYLLSAGTARSHGWCRASYSLQQRSHPLGRGQPGLRESSSEQ